MGQLPVATFLIPYFFLLRDSEFKIETANGTYLIPENQAPQKHVRSWPQFR